MTNTTVQHPLAGPRAAGWRSTFAVAAVLVIAAGCDTGSPMEPDLVARTGRDLPPDDLAGLVAEHLVSRDFIEPVDERLVMEVRGDLLFARGVVNGNSRREAVELLNGSPSVRTLVLTWVPGSVDDETNLALGRMLSQASMTTYLPRRAMAASGGTDLLVAGARRIVECGALVGVHSWASDTVNGSDLPRDAPEHRFYLDYYKDIGIPEAFYWFTLEAAAPDSIHWMTEDEMGRYEVHTHFRGPCGQVLSAIRSGVPHADPRVNIAYRGVRARDLRSGVHAAGTVMALWHLRLRHDSRSAEAESAKETLVRGGFGPVLSTEPLAKPRNCSEGCLYGS